MVKFVWTSPRPTWSNLEHSPVWGWRVAGVSPNTNYSTTVRGNFMNMRRTTGTTTQTIYGRRANVVSCYWTIASLHIKMFRNDIKWKPAKMKKKTMIFVTANPLMNWKIQGTQLPPNPLTHGNKNIHLNAFAFYILNISSIKMVKPSKQNSSQINCF